MYEFLEYYISQSYMFYVSSVQQQNVHMVGPKDVKKMVYYWYYAHRVYRMNNIVIISTLHIVY